MKPKTKQTPKQTQKPKPAKPALPEIGGIAVHCAHCAIVPVGDLKPYPHNNKRHPDAQLALLCKAIKAQGWRAPVTVSHESGYIVRGHARLEAAKRLGLKAVPVDYQHYASTAAEQADRIADNKLAELAEWDTGALREELLELDTGSLDMDLTGFDAGAMETLMTQFDYRLREFHVAVDPLPLTGVALGCYASAKWKHGPSEDYEKFLEWKKHPSQFHARTNEMAADVFSLIDRWARGWRGFVLTVPPPGASKGNEYPAGFLGKKTAELLGVDFVTVFDEWPHEKKHHSPWESREMEPPKIKTIPEGAVLIVDDAITSGATARNCLEALNGRPCWFFAWIGNLSRTSKTKKEP